MSDPNRPFSGKSKPLPPIAKSSNENKSVSSNQQENGPTDQTVSGNGSVPPAPPPAPPPDAPPPPGLPPPAAPPVPPPPTIASGDQNNDTSVPNEALNVPVEASAKKGKSKAKKGGIRFMNEVTDIDTGIKEQILSEDVSVKDMRENPYTNLLPDVSQKSVYKTAKVKTVKRERPNASLPKLQFGINDLLEKKSQLRNIQKEYKKVQLNREDVFDKHKEYDHFPLMSVYHDLKEQVLTLSGRLTSLNLSGVEQLTDMFFAVLIAKQLEFKHLSNLNLTGCSNLTDMGMYWVTKHMPSIGSVYLRGCSNITERSIQYFLDGKQVIKDFNAQGANIRLISPKLEKSLALFNFRACPLISPATETYTKNPRNALSVNLYGGIGKRDHSQTHLDVFKITLLRHDPSLPSLGDEVLPPSNSKGLRKWSNWKPLPDSTAEFNVYEVDVGSGFENLVLSNGSVVVVPYIDNKDQSEVLRLAETIMSVLVQYPENVFMLANVSSDHDSKNYLSPAHKRHLVKDVLEVYRKSLQEKLEFVTERSLWYMNEHKYHEQIQYTAARRTLLYLDKLLEENSSLLMTVHFQNEKQSGFGGITEAVDTLQEKYPWHDFGVYPETKNAIKLAHRKEEFPAGFGSLTAFLAAMLDDTKMNLNIRSSYREMYHVFSLMSERGKCSFFPGERENLCIVNEEMLEKLCNGLTERKPEKKMFVSGIGGDVLGYSQSDLTDIIISSAVPSEMTQKLSEKQIFMMLSTLENMGIILKMPCQYLTKDSFAENSFGYILSRDLPEKSTLVDEFWPPDIPGDELQTQKIYVLPAFPVSLLHCLFSEYSGLYSFSLLWKTGFIVQIGPVTLLLELLYKSSGAGYNNPGQPAIVVASRVQQPATVIKASHEVKKSAATERLTEIMWNALKQLTVILNAFLQKRQIFAAKTLACQNCCPTQNRYEIMKTDNICEYDEIRIKASHDRGLHCRREQQKDQFDIVAYLGSEQVRHGTDFIPNHAIYDKDYEKQIVDSSSSSSPWPTRCFLCANCALEGINCYGNMDNGKTTKHCGCLLPGFLCPFCGICKRCVRQLTLAHSVTHPTFQSKEFTSASEIKNGYIIQTGSLISFAVSAHPYKVNMPMTLENFSHFQVVLTRGIWFTLQITVDKQEIYFNFGEGTLYQEVGDKKNSLDTELDVLRPLKMGDFVDVYLRPENELGDQCLEIQTNLAVLYRRQILNPSVNVSVNANKPGNVTLGSTHLRDVQTSLGLKMEFGESVSVDLFILKGKNLMDQDVYGSNFNDFHPFVRVKVGGKVVYETNWRTGSQVKWNEHVLFQMSEDAQEVEIVLYNKESMAEELIGIIMYNLEHLRELSEGNERQWVPVPLTKNASIQIKAIVKYLDKQGLEKKDEMVQGHSRNTLIRRCAGWLPTTIEQTLFQFSMDFKSLFENRFLDLAGSAVMISPRELPESRILLPSYQHIKADLLAHPLCMTRTEILEESSKDVQQGWHYHLTNARGYELIDYKASIAWSWQVLLMHRHKITLPPYDKLFPNISQDFNEDLISRGLHQYLKYLSIHLFLARGIDFKIENFKSMSKLRTNIKYLRQSLSSNIADSGLLEISSYFSDKRQLYLCPAHVSCWNKKMNFTKVPTDGYDEYYMFIKDLVLTMNNLETIPDDIFSTLINLDHVDLSHNVLRSIPESVGKCKKLRYLGLQENNLTDLPMTLSMCVNLMRINISRNKMDAVPAAIPQCSSLEILMMSDMFITSLPEEMGFMDNLEILYANGNCLTEVPESFSMLQRLTDLSLRGVFWFVRHDVTKMMSRNRFQELLEQHGHSRWLEEHSEDREELFSQFDDNANGILEEEEMGKLNATVFNIFPRLGYKGTETPDDDTPSGFPPQLMFLQNLRYLNLTYQGIVHIPDEIGLLTSLEHLILSYNPNLLSVSAKVGDLPLLTLELEECPLLKTPPKEIRERGFATTYAYLRRLLSGSVECKRTKLMLVGLGEAGKTSLARAMRQEGDLKNSLTGVEDITDGIDITKWIVKHEGDEISYSVWDFAGQTVYYNTHQFFLSNRAVYLLVWNVRLGHEHAGLKFWLSSIRVHAPKAPIFIVGTHVDQVSKVELPTEELKEQFNQIEGFFYVSSYSGQGIPELKEKLFSVTLQQEYMGERIPSAWLELEKIIVRQRNQLHVDTISFENVVNLAGEAGIVDRTEVSQAVQFLHDLGALQHFSSNVYLKSHIVINPQWIVDVMACVVSVKQSAIKEGRLNHRDLGEIWSSYKDDMYQWMLRLTEEFDLTYPVPGEDQEKINIVPCLLPETKTEFTWPEIHKNDDIYETKMVYTFDYLPAGLFNRGQVRLQEYSDSVIIWKTGSFLRKNGHIALLQQYKDTEMIVKVQGPIPENILFHVHEVFEGLILESYQGVHYDFTIPCPDCLKQNLKDPHMFPASIIRRAIELKAPFLQCMKYFHTISIVDLQAVTPPSSNNDFDVHLQKAVSGLQDLRRTMKIDLFISYCDVDAPDDRSEVIHPATVHEDLINAGYTCWFPEVTNKYSTDLMARALMDSTIFVVFMSTSYANDPTCADIFKYAKLTLGKPMVVIVVGEENFSWRKTNLGLLLPDVSFVNMINSKKQMYDGKFRELLQKLDELMNLATRNVSTESPECFISYCWKNSAQAVALGTRAEDKSLGYGDPREIKNYLEEEGVRCWIDVERIGMNGLFDEIAKGLLEAKMVVACVSDEYVQSPSCKKEFHYACTVLNIPIVLCVVGTGSEWRRSEVGILSVNCPIVSFQLESEAANNRLLELVQDSIQKVGKQDNNTNNNKAAEKTTEEEVKNEQQFQELYELAQRKFLRQIVNYASSHDVEPYPRIFMVDLVKQESQSTTQEDPEQEKQDPEKLKASISIEDKSDAFRLRQYCVYILCECDKGWHTVDEPMMLPEDFGSDLLDQFAPYLCRVTAIMKHSKTMVPNFLSDPDGQQYTKWLFESTAAVVPDFKTGYHQFRELVMNLDIHNKAGKLSRCRQTSGKTIWLCSQHVSEMKVTVLGKDTAPIKQKASVQTAINYTEEWLRKLDPKRLEAKFKSSKKADRKPVVYDLPGTRKAAPSSSVRTKKDVLEEIALTKGTTAGEVAKKTALLAELSSATGTAPHRITSKSSKLEREGSATSRTSQKTTKSGQTTPKLKRPTSQACIVM